MQPVFPQRHTGADSSVGSVVGRADLNVADVARGAVGAAVDQAVRDDSGADTGGHLDHHERIAVGEVRGVLAQRHGVGVVVDQHRAREAVANHVRIGYPSQPVMIGGLTTVALAKSTGPGHGDPDATHEICCDPGVFEEFLEQTADLCEPRFGSDRDVERYPQLVSRYGRPGR